MNNPTRSSPEKPEERCDECCCLPPIPPTPVQKPPKNVTGTVPVTPTKSGNQSAGSVVEFQLAEDSSLSDETSSTVKRKKPSVGPVDETPDGTPPTVKRKKPSVGPVGNLILMELQLLQHRNVVMPSMHGRSFRRFHRLVKLTLFHNSTAHLFSRLQNLTCLLQHLQFLENLLKLKQTHRIHLPTPFPCRKMTVLITVLMTNLVTSMVTMLMTFPVTIVTRKWN